jgi:cytochrome b6-f complex iron-sulfur subunit
MVDDAASTPPKTPSAAKAATVVKAPAASARPEPATAARPTAAKKETPKSRSYTTRRQLVWWSVFGFLAAGAAATVRFFFPRALFEPKTRFAIGYPSDFGIGVSTRFQQSNRIWVVRDSSRIFVIYARCTHLGCTPDWKEAENKFKCPCHGSGFDIEGVNFEGPAPKPLARVYVELDGEGKIIVDTARLYETEAWDATGAYVLA